MQVSRRILPDQVECLGYRAVEEVCNVMLLQSWILDAVDQLELERLHRG